MNISHTSIQQGVKVFTRKGWHTKLPWMYMLEINDIRGICMCTGAFDSHKAKIAGRKPKPIVDSPKAYYLSMLKNAVVYSYEL